MSESTYESAGFIIGLDLGQSNDYTALCVVERVVPPRPKPTAPYRPLTYYGGGGYNVNGDPMQGVAVITLPLRTRGRVLPCPAPRTAAARHEVSCDSRARAGAARNASPRRTHPPCDRQDGRRRGGRGYVRGGGGDAVCGDDHRRR